MSHTPPLKDIKDLSFLELQDHMRQNQQPAFRAQQIFSCVYCQGKKSFQQMNILPGALQQQLSRDFVFTWPSLQKEQVAKDGTRKFLFCVGPQEHVETVFIPAKKRGTVCLSTQLGCKFSCAFCASGIGGWRRHLSCAEIIGQILCVKERVDPKPVTHVVFMGIGEPFDNYQNVMVALRLMNEKRGLNIAARRITISTCGLVPEIKRFAQEGLQVELAVSLHAANDALRDQLMPVNRTYPLKELVQCCRWYARTTNRQVTFEYILLKDVNSRIQDAEELAALMQGWLCKVNLIAYNDGSRLPFLAPDAKQIAAFQDHLHRKRIVSTLRASRGQDIQGACGQLRQALR
ncbi:MAG TPA: 23S rRNA (adenine(2503)-C(2))-methyltransferase RlmN [Candidatus Omnitrophota bacterium]|nr:23S rRNA (adenine(2503)-C(2))-methyltransferase RlmN [Candidatus Omnitrophota bacterium]HQL41793.1 23S rRNA (adenine(2503)-C(2))-methyltransferase RlmN [Candidatus Omnitrophota bacterium]